MAILRKPYEISVWEDELIPAADGEPSYYKENKIMVIGTDEMTSPNKAFSPVLTKNVNGEVTLTFSMAYKYFDPASDSEVINPFVGYLINERKIKLLYDDEWYDFIIVDHQEDSESMIWQYTAKDALVNELSKNGYNIEFSTELGNNQGTAIELAKATLKNTDWQVDEENSDLLIQKVNEPMVRMKLTESSLSVYDIKEKQNTTISVDEEIYVFYSYIANKEVKFVQFMRAVDKPSFTYDDNENIIGKNYRILSDVTYTLDENEKVISFSVNGATAVYVQPSEEDLIQTVPLYTANQGYRIVYGPLTTYDPVMERTVERYEVANLADPEHPYEIYKYSDSDYTTSNVIMPLITNGSDFNIYENGSIQGWSNANLTTNKEEGKNKFQHLSLTSYPELAEGAPLVSLTDLTRIQGFLEMKFDNVVTTNYENTFFNSGFMDNAGIIDHISGGEEFVFRISAAKATSQHGDLQPLIASTGSNPDPGIHAIVAYYTEPSGEDNYLTKDYYRQVDTQGIILEFGNNNWVIDNPTVTGGYFSTDEHDVVDYKNYIINNVVQEPTTNSVYKVEGSNTEYVWDSAQSKYVEKNDTNFVNYYRTIASVKKPVTNTKLTDPTVKIGIFLYTINGDLCAENVYTYISDVQITRCVYDANEQPITIGNIPTTTVTDTPTYYIKPEEGVTKEQVDVYYTLAGVANSVGKQESDVTPIYNEDSEKILSISEAQSNCFNILQTICETFECWLKIEAERDEYGGIVAGTKKILLKEYAGKDNFAGFKYAINLKSIQRTLNSEEIVTKLIVDNVQSDYTDDGVMSIRNASSNPSGEAYILNLNYYINKGLIKNGQDCRQDIADYYAQMKELNIQLNQLRTEKAKLELALNKLNSDRNVYTELISAAKDQYNEGMVDFKKATGMDYNDYVDKYGTVQTIITVAPVKMSDINKVVPIPLHNLIPFSSTTERIVPIAYGFELFNNTIPFYADKYKIEPLGDTEEQPSFVSRVFKYENEAWKCQYVWTFDNEAAHPPGQGIGIRWLAAISHNSESDHGAGAITSAGITSTAKLVNYGYAYVDDKNYLAVKLVDINDATHYYYRLYRWSDITTSWESIYENTRIPSVNDTPAYNIQWERAWGNHGKSRKGETTLNNGDLTEHEAIIDIIGQLYVASSTINNYAGILSNLNQEYEKLKLQVNGAVDYTVTISSNDVTEENNQTYRYSRLMLSDYIDGSDTFEFYFHKNNGSQDDKVEFKSSVSTKIFEVYDLPNQWYSHITITKIPQHYSLINSTNESSISETPITIEILPQSAKNYQLVADERYKEDHPSLQEDIDKLQQQKDDYEKAFYSKYYHYIKEGTWSSNDYVDAELYYLDALQTSANSAMPKVEYSIDVAEVSELEGLENYIFDVGDKTYVEDTEFFGWHMDDDGVKSPAREEVIVSQVEWHLDEPETNVITVQNYKTRFEDLFQRLSATVQTVQYNEATYAKTSSILDENGTLNQNLLVDALNTVRGSAYALTSDGSVAINGDQIWIRDIQNLTNSQNIVRINSEGIGVSIDAGQNWTAAINGRGINAGLITVGNLRADEVTILDGNNPSFRWDKYGISAYKYQGGDTPYDLTTYVRLDQYGLYGVKEAENYHASSLADVKNQAQFGLTWDGFFIKNSYEGGGLVQITSDNDFQVINSDQTEKIKIGALEWTNDGVVTTTPVAGLAPSLYGIRINNNAGETVFKTGDDGNITITGTIDALGGNFSQLVTVGKNQSDVSYIAIDGTRAELYSSNYYNGAGYGWMINKDGDAVFNNITARGAIKTAVFEYAEIQAVGGVFLFRPSSTIKSAVVNGNDLLVTVEKPALFNEGSWCKVSNYTTDGTEPVPNEDNILGNNGLTHVYKIEVEHRYGGRIGSAQIDQAQVGDTTIIRLLDAAEMVEGSSAVTTAGEIIGGALINMGYKEGTYTTFVPLLESNPQELGLYEYDATEQTYVLTEDTEVVDGKTYYKERYENGIHNYGIGINSSDNTVNLPARAISLFETQIDETVDPKVSYNFRGILGTLPQLGANQASSLYNQYMKNTQGIYTDNMYIGDKDQFLAFYTDTSGESPKKKLRIKANEILFESGEDEHQEPVYTNINEIADGSIQTIVYSTLGTSLMNQTNYKGALYVRVTKADGEIDPIGADGIQTTDQPPEGGSSGDTCIYLDSQNRTATLYRNNEGTWSPVTLEATYEWTFRNTDGTEITSPTELQRRFGNAYDSTEGKVYGKCLYVDATTINKKLIAEVKVIYEEN